jgi:hypothetical protein
MLFGLTHHRIATWFHHLAKRLFIKRLTALPPQWFLKGQRFGTGSGGEATAGTSGTGFAEQMVADATVPNP